MEAGNRVIFTAVGVVSKAQLRREVILFEHLFRGGSNLFRATPTEGSDPH